MGQQRHTVYVIGTIPTVRTYWVHMLVGLERYPSETLDSSEDTSALVTLQGL